MPGSLRTFHLHERVYLYLRCFCYSLHSVATRTRKQAAMESSPHAEAPMITISRTLHGRIQEDVLHLGPRSIQAETPLQKPSN